MPPENNSPTFDGGVEGAVRRTSGRGSNMVAYKPRGERGPTVYRDTTDIPPEHMARLNGASARFAPRESAQVEQPAPDAPLASDIPRPDASAGSMRASQLSMPQLGGSIALAQAALVTMQQELQRRAAALRLSRRRPDVTFLGEVLPGIMEPSGDGVVFGDESNLERTLSEPDRIREELKKRREAELAEMAEEAARLRNRNKPKKTDGSEIERPVGASDDLFPWKLVDPPPQPLSGSRDADDMPPTYSPVPPPTGWDPFEKRERQRTLAEDIEEAKRIYGPHIFRRADEPHDSWIRLPARNEAEELERLRQLDMLKLRPGTGLLGPWPITGFPYPVGLWGGGELRGPGIAGGAFIQLPWVRVWFGGSIGPDGDRVGLGGEGGISIPIR